MLFTIGYEKASLDDVIARLQEAGVARVIDVRAVAASRRAGFSKTALSASLAEAGIDYVHLRALGTPKAGREAARTGRIAEMRTIFEGQLATPEAVDAMARAAALADEAPSALLCFEADAVGCHRRVVAERLAEATGLGVRDL
jgi:uncharacterized protein (DUF488 family)